MSVTLLNGDCLELMAGIPDGSIDAIICDLPYGTTACKWDTVIPFEPLWKHYKRVIKRNGAIVLFGSQPFTTLLIASNLPMFKYEWIWEKSVATSKFQVNYQPLKIHEQIIVFGHGRVSHGTSTPLLYFPQMGEGEPYEDVVRPCWPAFAKGRMSVKSGTKLAIQNTGTRYPKSILRFPKRNAECTLHPTQKPVALLEYLIHTYTNEGETVLDNTFGSCTAGVACVNLNRNFVGIELDEGYYNIGVTRITEAQNKARQLTLEGVA